MMQDIYDAFYTEALPERYALKHLVTASTFELAHDFGGTRTMTAPTAKLSCITEFGVAHAISRDPEPGTGDSVIELHALVDCDHTVCMRITNIPEYHDAVFIMPVKVEWDNTNESSGYTVKRLKRWRTLIELITGYPVKGGLHSPYIETGAGEFPLFMPPESNAILMLCMVCPLNPPNNITIR